MILFNKANPLPQAILVLGLISGSAMAADSEAELGELLYQDGNLSNSRQVSCAGCHSLNNPGLLGLGGNSPSFVDNFTSPFNIPISFGGLFLISAGTLNSPSAGYAALTPEFHQETATGDYVGGQFWNGRASTLADQAEKPFLNPVEMGLSSEWDLVTRLKENEIYIAAFNKLYGIDLNAIPAYLDAPATANAPAAVRSAFRAASVAIGEFEQTEFFNRFTSKYDFYLAGQATLSASERRGMNLFNGAAGCSSCHISTMDSGPNALPPLFTDFKYYNLGVPRNYGIPGNPTPDKGLAENPQVIADGRSETEIGKHKVVSLRNIAKTQPYMHNGIFTSLEQVVHFYNTRDALPHVGNNLWWGFGIWQWAAPEYSQNQSFEVGNLGLNAQEGEDIVAFLKTLTDGYKNKTTSPWTSRVKAAVDALHPVNDMY